MVEKFSKAKTSMLKTDLNFEVKIKVVGDFKIYNFHEENFSKFETELQEKNQILQIEFEPGFQNSRVFTKFPKRS
jgi:hypothetical protein